MNATDDQQQKALRAKNVRTGLILAGLVLGLFAAFIVRSWYMRFG